MLGPRHPFHRLRRESLLAGLLLAAACGAPLAPEEAPEAPAQSAPALVQPVQPGATITAADIAALPPGALLGFDLRLPEASYGVDFSDGAGDLSRIRVTLRSGKSQLLPEWLEALGQGASAAPSFRVSAPGVSPQIYCCKVCACGPEGCSCTVCRRC